MEITAIVTAVSQVGFPIICCYMLIKQVISRLDRLNVSLENLQDTLLYINTMEMQNSGNGRKARLKRRVLTRE